MPALVPINRSFNTRITRAEKIEALFDPFGLPHAGFINIVREFAGRPFRDHDWFLRIEPAHFLIRPVNQRRNVRIRLVLVLLTVNAQAKPIDVIGAGIIRWRSAKFQVSSG